MPLSGFKKKAVSTIANLLEIDSFTMYFVLFSNFLLWNISYIRESMYMYIMCVLVRNKKNLQYPYTLFKKLEHHQYLKNSLPPEVIVLLF